VRDGSASKTLTFSGDLGVHGSRLMGAPEPVACPDVLIMESTYGNRSRDTDNDRTEELYGIVRRTIDRGGKVVIPSFAVGRTQEVLARLNDLVESGRIPGIPVFVDSPMAISATRIFGEHPQALSDKAIELIREGDDPLEFPDLHFTRSVEDSKAIADVDGPAVIISASGMCTAGRIKHHLSAYISDPRTTILFVGYQAAGTLGRLIESGVSPVRIFGAWHDVNAEITKIEGFSAHADREELHAWFESLGGRPDKTIIVHGEEQAALAMADGLRDRHEIDVIVPGRGAYVDLP
jgi:metallo-beta-lactamase family protein